MVAWKNNVWYFHDKKDNITVITNNSNLISSLFLKEGNNPPYQALSNLINNPASSDEWKNMQSNYPLI